MVLAILGHTQPQDGGPPWDRDSYLQDRPIPYPVLGRGFFKRRR